MKENKIENNYDPRVDMSDLWIDIRGFIGYIVDLWRVIKGRISNPHSFTKFRLLNKLRKETGAKVLIETGTFLGVTTRRASWVFDRVFTIELDEKLAEKATKKFSNKSKVTVIKGDVIDKLEEVMLENEVEKAIIFLDAHFSKGITAKGPVPEPALEEIKCLARHRNKVLGFIVDDFRSFGRNEGFPKKSELIEIIEEEFINQGGWDLKIHFDSLIVNKF